MPTLHKMKKRMKHQEKNLKTNKNHIWKRGLGNKRGRKREGPSKGNASMKTEPKKNLKIQRMKIKTRSGKGN
jgi:hypothetical protein